MIQNCFPVIHMTIERIIIGKTKPAHDVPGTYPEGPLKVLTSRTNKGPSGDSQGSYTKIDFFCEKIVFQKQYIICNITYLFLFFTGRTNIQKLQTGPVDGVC